MIDPLLRNFCGTEVRNVLSSLLKEDQPQRATEETDER
jgi:hypothetical protein